MIVFTLDLKTSETIRIIFDVISKGASILGVVLIVTGIISYAMSHADGDGPGQKKSVYKFTGGILLIALSILTSYDTQFIESFLNSM